MINLITPETQTSSHYFWTIARQYRLDEADLTEYIRERISTTFDQDKHILEAQQRAFGPEPDDASPVPVHLDAGPILGRRLLAAALEREST